MTVDASAVGSTAAAPSMAAQSPRQAAVGIIGIGAMGFAMARNLHARGWRVGVRDVDGQAETRAVRDGLQAFASPRALAASSDILVIVVVDAPQIDAVLFDADTGAALAAGSGGARIVMLCSTIAPKDTKRFADRLAEHGIATIDAPISGGPARALAGSMSMMLAAPEPTLAPWQELLADLAEKRFVISAQVGDAARAKLVNNLLAGINLVAAAEALSLAAKVGLDPRAVFELVRASSGNSWVFEDRMPRALDEEWTPARAAARLLTKDLGLATELAAGVGHETPLGDAALGRFEEAVARGWAELDDAAVIKTYQA